MQFTMTISWLIILLLKQPRINHSGINYGISFICLKAAEFFLIIYASIKTSNGEI
jgi:hypothetical protein